MKALIYYYENHEILYVFSRDEKLSLSLDMKDLNVTQSTSLSIDSSLDSILGRAHNCGRLTEEIELTSLLVLQVMEALEAAKETVWKSPYKNAYIELMDEFFREYA